MARTWRTGVDRERAKPRRKAVKFERSFRRATKQALRAVLLHDDEDVAVESRWSRTLRSATVR